MPALGGWEGFDKLVLFLKQHYGASVARSVDGPDARVCDVVVRSATPTIEYEDPWGSTIVSADPRSSVLREIAVDLERRFLATRAEDPRGRRAR